jgi:hypothetical protein
MIIRSDDEPKQLYRVLKEKEAPISGFMGTQHVYDLGNTRGSKVGDQLMVKHPLKKVTNADVCVA